ncbi:MAG: hypothetical protein ACLU1W_04640 [Collinsella sp.]
MNIVELDTIKSLVESNHVVISCGGGGIPVTKARATTLRALPPSSIRTLRPRSSPNSSMPMP